jgi:high-affinity Fe2+/Pb2+ permease
MKDQDRIARAAMVVVVVAGVVGAGVFWWAMFNVLVR